MPLAVPATRFPVPLITILPKIKETKDFLLMARWKDARSIKIKKKKDNVELKVQCSRYLVYLGHHRQRQRNKSSPCPQFWQ